MSVISTKSSVVSATSLVVPASAASTTTITSHLSGHPVYGRGQSPRGPSPNRERDSHR